MKTVTIRELMYAVIHDDNFDMDISSHDVEHVLGIAMKKIGLVALIESTRVDLGNNNFLNISVSQNNG